MSKCSNLAQIAKNFMTQNHSYTKICEEKGVIDIPVRLILQPMFAARPYPLLYKYPPRIMHPQLINHMSTSTLTSG